MIGKPLATFLSFLTLFLDVYSQDEVGKDSLLLNLEEVEVSGTAVRSRVQPFNKGRISWDLKDINTLPQILGQSDPVRYSQTLPGISTNNEYDGGLHIYGCDNTHNQIGIEGVPLYNVSHLLGFFSIFNTSHFPDFSIDKTAVNAGFPNRLGGAVSMNLPKEIPDSVNGDISLGMISSQGTLDIPLGRNNMVSLSARLCYVNLLYSRALKIDDSRLKYSFGDINALWLHKFGEGNTLTVSFFGGRDYAEMQESNFLSSAGLKWSNLMMLAKWERRMGNGAMMKHVIYYTGYENRFGLDQESIEFKLPSKISDIACKGEIKRRNFDLGWEAVLHRITPQSPRVEGSYNTVNDQESQILATQEYSLYADSRFPLSEDVVVSAGLRGSLYVDNDKKSYFAIDPSVALSVYKSRWDFSAALSVRHQYVYQTGFSSMGLPTEFWMTCNNRYKPQKGLNLIATLGYKINGNLRASAEMYYKHLKNLVEYNGNILDFVQTDYDIDNHLYQGKGRNYGINLMLTASAGKFSGWLSYNLGRALRTFHDKGLDGEFPANHERISEMNIVGTFELDRHWSFGATYVLASGTPFTAPEHFYVFSGNIIAQYGEHNACRLSPYSRLDLSANYKFMISQKYESGLNLSVYNVLAKSNELFWQMRVRNGDELAYRPMSFVVNIMPSVSYYIKF